MKVKLPRTTRFFFAYGWALVLIAALCFSWLLTGCGEAQSWAADQASLADAIAHRHQKEDWNEIQHH